MNRYGQMALDYNRRHRPDVSSQIPDLEAFFAEAGEAIAADVTWLRDEILDPVRPGENLEAYRLRSYQALATAEERVIAEHYLFQPNPSADTEKDWSDDPDLDRRYRNLEEINQAINTPL